MATINPYVCFNGNAEEAFNFYASVFGGKPDFMRFKDAPPSEHQNPAEAEKIMHACLPIGNGDLLMGSDAPEMYGKVTNGTAYNISVSVATDEEAEKTFAALSNGGQIHMPMERTFWASRFGMCSDKFGIQWMVGTDSAEKE